MVYISIAWANEPSWELKGRPVVAPWADTNSILHNIMQHGERSMITWFAYLEEAFIAGHVLLGWPGRWMKAALIGRISKVGKCRIFLCRPSKRRDTHCRTFSRRLMLLIRTQPIAGATSRGRLIRIWASRASSSNILGSDRRTVKAHALHCAGGIFPSAEYSMSIGKGVHANGTIPQVASLVRPFQASSIANRLPRIAINAREDKHARASETVRSRNSRMWIVLRASVGLTA